ncbi:VCBS repeat-containing protein, partial [Candidatus Sumerlaeota bacterium]|nr:VCBS repeat-containing protein [Candidatus Sumerlaeota bacterium]
MKIAVPLKREISALGWLLPIVFVLSILSYQDSSPQEYERVMEGILDNQKCALYGGATDYSAPELVDIDNDGDLDLFLGSTGGGVLFYRNDGIKQFPSWSLVTENYASINVASGNSKPCFVDIDSDGDFDLFIGQEDGTIRFYRNDGTSLKPFWVEVLGVYDFIDVGDKSDPTFTDIDNDGDYDMFIGNHYGRLVFYQNIGSKESPVWTLISDYYSSIDVGLDSSPMFIDIDNDRDQDLFIGNSEGKIAFYQNDGNVSSPLWNLITSDYVSLQNIAAATPFFADTDGDGDFDLWCGSFEGVLKYSENVGDATTPVWSSFVRKQLALDIGEESVPAFADIDADGDLDLFIYGVNYKSSTDYGMCYYRNDGSVTKPVWHLVTELYNSIDILAGVPRFVDIDADFDLDLFIGDFFGFLHYFRNDGTPQTPIWVYVTDDYASASLGLFNAPEFVDIDADGDFDLFVGHWDGTISFYRNVGTPYAAQWNLVDIYWNSIDVGSASIPVFADVDSDGDFDLLVGERSGKVNYFRNDGSPTSPSFTLLTEDFMNINVNSYSTPAAVDIDDDEDIDLFIGDIYGGLQFYRNISRKVVVCPSAVTIVPGGVIDFITSGTVPGGVSWSFVDNRSGGTLDSVSGHYVAGSVTGVVDVIQATCLTTPSLIGRAHINVISASDITRAGKAIIMAGTKGTATDPLWETTNYLANFCYQTLLYKGFSKENIYYLNPEPNQDVDGDGADDDIDADSTLANFQYAVETWTTDTHNLLIYLIDHGGDSGGAGYFRCNGSELLYAGDLDGWLDALQMNYPCTVTLVVDCCNAGSFLDELTAPSGKVRVAIASTEPTQEAFFAGGGLVSFTADFINCVYSGYSLAASFDSAAGAMDRYQTPQMDDNNDGVYNKDTDGDVAGGMYIGASFIAGADRPQIGKISANQTIQTGSSALIWASEVSSIYAIDRVWATIVPPDFQPNPDQNPEQPIIGLPQIDLIWNPTTERYEGIYSNFDKLGAYKVIIYAQDVWGSVSFPKQCYINQLNADEKVIIVCGDGDYDTNSPWAWSNYLTNYAYLTCLERWIKKEKIRYFNSSSQDVDGDGSNDVYSSPTVAGLSDAITIWAADADKLTLFLVGNGTTDEFNINASENISAADLDGWLDTLQSGTDCLVIVIIDSLYSGSF